MEHAGHNAEWCDDPYVLAPNEDLAEVLANGWNAYCHDCETYFK